MYNDSPDFQKQENKDRFDHVPYAFLAAKHGEHDFLEILLGPSIPAERYQYEKLTADMQELYDQLNLWEFKSRIFKTKVDIIKSHGDGDLKSLNEKLAASVEPLVETSVLAWVDRVNERGAVCYHGDSPVFPSVSLDNIQLKEQEKMSAFFARWEHEKPNDRGYYFIILPEYKDAKAGDVMMTLHELQKCRYGKIAEAAHFEIENLSNLPRLVLHLEATIRVTDKIVDDVLRQKSILNDQVCELDLLYNDRKRHLRTLADKFKDKPYLLPSAYRVPSTELKQLLESAKVSVNVRDEAGNTLMHVASQAREYNVVRLLLDHGADIYSRNDNRSTPWDLAGLKSAVELQSLARVYKKRSESKFLADVVRDFQLYKKDHEEILASSFRRRLHLRTEERLNERTKQLADLEAGIKKAQTFPTDDLLMVKILTENSLATRGKRGRSNLFDPLMTHVRRYLTQQGYGISKQDIIRAFNDDYLAEIEIELALERQAMSLEIQALGEKLDISLVDHQTKDALIEALNDAIKKQDEILAKQADLLSKKDRIIASYEAGIEVMSAQHEQFAEVAKMKIEALPKVNESSSDKPRQQGSELPAELTGDEVGVSVSGAHAALFNARHSLSASQGRILLETLENAQTINRPN